MKMTNKLLIIIIILINLIKLKDVIYVLFLNHVSIFQLRYIQIDKIYHLNNYKRVKLQVKYILALLKQ